MNWSLIIIHKWDKKISNADQYSYPSNSYINDYIQQYSFPDNSADNVDKGYYVLDIIQKFGKYNPSKKEGYPEASTIWSLVQEYKIVTDTADEKLQGSKRDFDEIFNNQFGEFTSALDDGKETIGKLKTTFNDFKAEMSGMIVDYSETIDNYVKLGFKIIFGVLALLNIAIAVFMHFLYFCSGKCCTKCCCCWCICKLFTHLLWNILALLMIIVFLVGSLFFIIGKIGEDGMNVISYIVSEDNIGDGGDNILVDQIGDSVKYLRRYLNFYLLDNY